MIDRKVSQVFSFKAIVLLGSLRTLDIKVDCSKSVGVKLTNHWTRTQVILKDLLIVSDILLLCSQISSTQNRCKILEKLKIHPRVKVFEILT